MHRILRTHRCRDVAARRRFLSPRAKGRDRADVGEGSLVAGICRGARRHCHVPFSIAPYTYIYINSYHTRDAALTTFFRVRSESHGLHIHIIYAIRASITMHHLQTANMLQCDNRPTDRRSWRWCFCALIKTVQTHHPFPVVTNLSEEHNTTSVNFVRWWSSMIKCRCPDWKRNKAGCEYTSRVHRSCSSLYCCSVLIWILSDLSFSFIYKKIYPVEYNICTKTRYSTVLRLIGRLRRNTHGAVVL